MKSKELEHQVKATRNILTLKQHQQLVEAEKEKEMFKKLKDELEVCVCMCMCVRACMLVIFRMFLYGKLHLIHYYEICKVYVYTLFQRQKAEEKVKIHEMEVSVGFLNTFCC